MFAIGYDIGSSSVKAGIVDLQSGTTVKVVQSPTQEMEIISSKPEWAEQLPETWWHHVCQATKSLLKQTNISPSKIKSIGISYQMHGLVMVDKDMQSIRPAIIWCDSRAVTTGKKAFHKIGHSKCLRHLLNSPGNFTVSKLAWVKQHEPEKFKRLNKLMLPGDYIAMRLTGEITTTIQGMSEGIFWDFKSNDVAEFVLDAFGIEKFSVPPVQEAISMHGVVNPKAAEETGLLAGTPVTYRAGDQPNNAMSLNVLNPGEVAATGGTSGVVFGVVDQFIYDQNMRVNSFAHVNHQSDDPRIGILLCINGTGSAYRFIRQLLNQNQSSYHDLEEMACRIPIGSIGLRAYPFGNGAERMLLNQNPGARFENVHFNIHEQAHFYRSVLEGIAYSFMYGIRIMKKLGLKVTLMKSGNDNLFQSQIFSQTLSNLIDGEIQLIETTGAIGAAKASAVEIGHYSSIEEAMSNQKIIQRYTPDETQQQNLDFYHKWVQHLNM
jgi:xylulokinase